MVRWCAPRVRRQSTREGCSARGWDPAGGGYLTSADTTSRAPQDRHPGALLSSEELGRAESATGTFIRYDGAWRSATASRCSSELCGLAVEGLVLATGSAFTLQAQLDPQRRPTLGDKCPRPPTFFDQTARCVTYAGRLHRCIEVAILRIFAPSGPTPSP
jgi:hypothetical protein